MQIQDVIRDKRTDLEDWGRVMWMNNVSMFSPERGHVRWVNFLAALGSPAERERCHTTCETTRYGTHWGIWLGEPRLSWPP